MLEKPESPPPFCHRPGQQPRLSLHTLLLSRSLPGTWSGASGLARNRGDVCRVRPGQEARQEGDGGRAGRGGGGAGPAGATGRTSSVRETMPPRLRVPEEPPASSRVTVLLCLVPVLLITIFPGRRSGRFFFLRSRSYLKGKLACFQRFICNANGSSE